MLDVRAVVGRQRRPLEDKPVDLIVEAAEALGFNKRLLDHFAPDLGQKRRELEARSRSPEIFVFKSVSCLMSTPR